MSSYTLFGQKVVFSEAADRFYYILNAFETAVESASAEFEEYYRQTGNIAKVLDDYVSILCSITQTWAIEPLYDTLKNAEIYDVSEDAFEDACWDLTSAEQYYDCIADQYNTIVGELADAKQYRSLRKSSRGRFGWRSSTDWGDITNAAITAGTLNAMSGIGHSIINGIGNLGSSISAASSQKALYNNHKTVELLDTGIRECIKSIYLLYMDFVNEYKENEGKNIWYDGSQYDSEKADVLLKNSGQVEGKEKELLFRAFSVCPYHYNVSASIFLKYEEERKNIFEIAAKYKNDLTPLLKNVISNLYTEEAKKSEKKAKEAKYRIKEIMEEYGIDQDETLDQIECDCLTRLCNPYRNLLPEESNSIIQSLNAYDAARKNKATVIKTFGIWELAPQYGITFSDNEKEEIVSRLLKLASAKYAQSYQEVLIIIRRVMGAAEIKSSKALDSFEYYVLEGLAKSYSSCPVGEAHEIIEKIASCEVSKSSKVKYIYDHDIWELTKQYQIHFTDKDRERIIGNAFNNMVTVPGISEEDILEKLDQILEMFDIKDSSGIIDSKTAIALFESITGLREAKASYARAVKNTADILTATIDNNVERIISDSGIAFMSLSLCYLRKQLEKDAPRLRYCTLSEKECPFIIYDAKPIMDSLAYGFCLTNKRLIAKQESSSFELDVKKIISFEKKGFLSSKMVVNSQQGIRELDVGNLSELSKFADCLNQIIRAIPEMESGKDRRETEAYSLHIKQCLRCVETYPYLIDYFGADATVTEIKEQVLAQSTSLETKKEGINTSSALVSHKYCVATSDVSSQMPASLNNQENTLSMGTTYKVQKLMLQGNKLEAIRIIREETGAGLADALKTAESLVNSTETTHPENTPPNAETQSLQPQSMTITQPSAANNTQDEPLLPQSAYIDSVDRTQSIQQQINMLAELYGNNITTSVFTVGTAPYEKKITKAKSAYAPISSAEIPLMMEDYTLFGSAKEGIVITNQTIYQKDILEPKRSFSISDVKDVVYRQAGKEFYYIEAVTTQKNYKLSSSLSKTKAEQIACFYKDVLELIKDCKANSDTRQITSPRAKSTPDTISTNLDWICVCGERCTGKFCPACGQPRPQSTTTWKCVCGSINEGNFCSNCGRKRQ